MPIPVRPPLVIMKLVAEDEPITNDGLTRPGTGFMERSPHGEVVPTPSVPETVAFEETVSNEVLAIFVATRIVEVELVLVELPVMFKLP